MDNKTTTTVAKIMQYKKLLITSVIAITFAMMFTATIPFQQQQEAYAGHEGVGLICSDIAEGSVPAHQGGVILCVPAGEIERACAINPNAFDECRQEEPLDERYPDQGTCIDAGENKDACKAAFKADKKPKNE